MALWYKQDSPVFGVWRMEESSDELLTMLEHKVEYQPFLERVTAEKRRQEHLACRVLLKELLGVETLVDYYPTGAPFLPHMPLYISISHTKDFVAVILDEHSTGIDLEYRSDRIVKIRSRFMSAEEEACVEPQHEVEHLLIHWCAKETLFKVMGQENIDFQEHLHVRPFPYGDQGVLIAAETRTPDRLEYELAYQVTPEYVLTWCCSDRMAGRISPR